MLSIVDCMTPHPSQCWLQRQPGSNHAIFFCQIFTNGKPRISQGEAKGKPRISQGKAKAKERIAEVMCLRRLATATKKHRQQMPPDMAKKT